MTYFQKSKDPSCVKKQTESQLPILLIIFKVTGSEG